MSKLSKLSPADQAIESCNQWRSRFRTQVRFARELARLVGAQAADWENLITAAEQIVQDAGVGDMPDAVRRAEAGLAPIAKVAKAYTIHCVAHAHLDLIWTWSWPETVAMVLDQATTTLRLMDEFPGFTYLQSQPATYEIIQQFDPDLFERVGRRIREGRWEAVGALWCEGDKNMASGEALVRHLLQGRQYMAEAFGMGPADQLLDWEPDTSGHAASIPAILSGGQVRRYYLSRAGSDDLPHVFWWTGPGSSHPVLVYREYGTGYFGRIGANITRKMMRFCGETGLKDWMNVYGIGDHGGGPSRRDLMRIGDMNAWPVYPNIRFSSAKAFYDILEAAGDRWPKVERELNFEWPGCYSSESNMKRINRLGENLCLAAEAVAALGQRVPGRPYPAQALHDAWRKVLFGHFHDIMPGCAAPEGQAFQWGQFQHAAAACGQILTQTYRQLAQRIDTSSANPGEAHGPEVGDVCMGGGPGVGAAQGQVSQAGHARLGQRAMVVLNASPFDRREVVTCRIWDNGDGEVDKHSYALHNPDGQALAAQNLGGGVYHAHRYVDLVFPAHVEGLGYRAYGLGEGGDAGEVPAKPVVFHDRRQYEGQPIVGKLYRLENEHILATFDTFTGGIVHLVDKASGIDLAAPDHPMAVLEYVLERHILVPSCVVGETQRRVYPIEVSSQAPVHRGPCVASLRTTASFGQSRFELTYTLRAGARQLDIDLRMTWLEVGSKDIGTPSMLMRFPVAPSDAVPRYEIPFGSVQRTFTSGEQVPALRWANVVGRHGDGRLAGLALLNDSRYSHSWDGHVLRLMMVRSTAAEDPLPDLAQHHVRMAVVPHDGRLSEAEIIRMAAAFNQPLTVLPTDVHAGDLPPHGWAVSIVEGADQAVITSVKEAEDGRGLIIRLMSASDELARVQVRLNPTMLGHVTRATRTDLLERTADAEAVETTDDGFSVVLAPRVIATVRVALA